MSSHFQGSVCPLLATLIACIACHSPLATGAEPAVEVTAPSEWETRIEAALDTKGEWDFVEAPLNDVCHAIQEKLGIDVVLDVRALDDFGIDRATPITRSLRGVSNRAFLRLMLSDLELTYMPQLGALWITTPEAAESRLTTKIYPAFDLRERDDLPGNRAANHVSLITALKDVVSPDTWDDVGGPGSVQGIYDMLVISQTYDIHQKIEQFLTAYRSVIANGRNTACLILGEDEGSAIQAALDKSLTAEFDDATLKEVVEFIAAEMDIPIVIDVRALDDIGIDTSAPINLRFTKTPLRYALARLLNELELTFTIRDEVLLITTLEECVGQLDVGLYPVRDLVQVAGALPIDPPGANFDFDSLIRVLTSTIAPDSWDEVGGPGAISPLLPEPTLLVAQTRDVHEHISALLAAFRSEKQRIASHSAAVEDVDPAALVVRSYLIDVAYSPEEIATLVMRASDPQTWDHAGGTFVQGLGMALVVKHNATIHRRVQKLLAQLGVWYPGEARGLSGGNF